MEFSNNKESFPHKAEKEKLIIRIKTHSGFGVSAEHNKHIIKGNDEHKSKYNCNIYGMMWYYCCYQSRW